MYLNLDFKPISIDVTKKQKNIKNEQQIHSPFRSMNRILTAHLAI